MLRGSRRTILAIVGITISGLFLWNLASDLSSRSDGYKREAAHASERYRDRAEEHISRACLTAPEQAQLGCIQETEEAAREGQRKEQDLAAQNVTAWWTNVMGIAAIIGMALSATGLWLILATLNESQKAANAALAQVAMMRAAQVPDLVVGNITYLQKTGPTSAQIVQEPIATGYIQVGLTNRNRDTLTYVLPSSYGWAVAAELPPVPTYNRAVEWLAGADRNAGAAPGFFFDVELSEPDITGVLQGSSHLWIWMRIEVQDVLKGTHVLGFAAKWVHEGFRPYGEDHMWGNHFQAVLDPAYNYREHTSGS